MSDEGGLVEFDPTDLVKRLAQLESENAVLRQALKRLLATSKHEVEGSEGALAAFSAREALATPAAVPLVPREDAEALAECLEFVLRGVLSGSIRSKPIILIQRGSKEWPMESLEGVVHTALSTYRDKHPATPQP